MLTKEQYEAKRQARYERLLKAAERAQTDGKASLDAGDKMFSVIPFGQPILVGHYSEQRDRNYRQRAHDKISRGYALYEKASQLRERAEASHNNDAIFSDDPSAIEKLEEKISRLEKRQELMKAANKLVRKNDRAGLAALGFSEARISRLFIPDFCGRVGYPDFEIKNNNANIRRLKERLQVVEKKQSLHDEDFEVNGVRVEGRPGENRIRLFYPARVDRETFDLLRRHGFRVLRSEGEGAFSAYYNNNALYFVRIHVMKKGEK